VERLDTALPDVLLLKPRVFEDERGFFLEIYNQRTLASLGVRHPFVQDNHSCSRRGVVRGLHYQIAQPQAKLVRVTRGRVFDVMVDIRRGSPTFGGFVATELSADNKLMLYAPEGFAHGFLVLSEVAEFEYKCSDFYSPGSERGVVWDDPELAIPWPLGSLEPVLSAKDLSWGSLGTIPSHELPVWSGAQT
jgi:dTDP-4-dehydrorhamnose 3,5-epimerase